MAHPKQNQLPQLPDLSQYLSQSSHGSSVQSMGSSESTTSMSYSNQFSIQVPQQVSTQVSSNMNSNMNSQMPTQLPPQVSNKRDRIEPMCTPDGRQIFQTANGTQFVRLRVSDYHELLRRLDLLDKQQLHNMKVLAALKQHMDALSKDIANCEQLRRQNQIELCGTQCNCDGQKTEQRSQSSQPANDMILHSQQIVSRQPLNIDNGQMNQMGGQMTTQLQMPPQQRRVLPLPQMNLNQNGQEQQTWTAQNVLPSIQ